MVHLFKGRLRRHIPVIGRPTPDYGVECLDQDGLTDVGVVLDELADLLQERVRVLLRGLDHQFPREGPEMLAEEVEAFADMRDACLLG
ncbi:MAG: hypothetical protein BWX44_01536 [Spirochaetes bacterium ADurb.Bin001]|nr:MAG: hypothetical protein BWX44_01536 [Spirochaetes bacterium ADurb.Bin001]